MLFGINRLLMTILIGVFMMPVAVPDPGVTGSVVPIMWNTVNFLRSRFVK